MLLLYSCIVCLFLIFGYLTLDNLINDFGGLYFISFFCSIDNLLNSALKISVINYLDLFGTFLLERYLIKG